MKTIKVFLSSSCELIEERDKLAEVFVGLNNIMINKDILFQLVKWEYLDAGTEDVRTQDEYNELLRTCNMCVVLFWRKVGKFTDEEMKEACKIKKSNGKLKDIYVLFKSESGLRMEDNEVIYQLYKRTIDNEMVSCDKYKSLDELKVKLLKYCLEFNNMSLDASDVQEMRNGELMVGRFCCFGKQVKDEVKTMVKQ